MHKYVKLGAVIIITVMYYWIKRNPKIQLQVSMKQLAGI